MSYEYSAAEFTKKPCKDVRQRLKCRLDAVDAIQPPVLYHYTNWESFTKIVNCKSILASKIADLNDREERNHGRKLFAEAIGTRLKYSTGKTVEFLKRLEYEAVTGAKWSQDYETAFSISVSSAASKEYMFNEYGESGRGLGVGFCTAKLDAAAKRAFLPTEKQTLGLSSTRMIYKASQKTQLMEELLRDCEETLVPILPMCSEQRSNVMTDIVHQAANAGFVLASRFKEERWCEEEEWRISPWLWHDSEDFANEANLTIIDGRSRLRVCLKTRKCCPLGICRIHLGPKCQESVGRDRVEQLLGQNHAVVVVPQWAS